MSLDLSTDLDTPYLQKTYGDDKDIIVLLFKAFLKDSIERWKSLKAHIEQNDLHEAAKLIHTIKPSFVMVGIGSLRPAVLALEQLILKPSSADSIIEAYLELDEHIQKYEQILTFEISRLESLD